MKDRNKTTAGVLAIVLGAFGAHYFYMGNIEKAMVRLLLSIFIFPCAVVFFILGIIDGVKILSMSDQDFSDRFYELRGEMSHADANEPADPAADAGQKEPADAPAAKPKAATTTGYMEQFEILRTYKELLDSGAITEEEFSLIKKSLMR